MDKIKAKKAKLNKQIKKFVNQIDYLQKKAQFQEIKQSYKAKKKRISTSKLALGILLANFFIIEIFTGIMTIKAIQIATFTGMMDWTPLVTLIGAIAGSTVSLLGYYAKSAKENTKNGIVYQTTLMQKTQEETYYYNNDGISVG